MIILFDVMNWKSHTLIAFFLSLAIFYFVFSIREAVQIPQLLFLSIFSALSALVPDLDHDLSKGRKLLDAVVIVFAFGIAAYFYFFNSASGIPSSFFGPPMIFFAIPGFYFIAFKILKPRHRGATHTIVLCFAFSVLVYLIAGLQLAVAGLIGYFSHLLVDKEIKLL